MMSQLKNILLIGCGAEIGSMLVGMVKPEVDGFSIGAILTNDIPGDSHHPNLTAIDSLLARIVLAQPHLIDEVSVNHEADEIVVRGSSIPVYWGDATGFDTDKFSQTFDLAIVATSKKHINDGQITGNYLNVAKYVVGVAEAVHLPAIYPSLIGAPDRFLDSKLVPIADHRIFCLGSCQSNGWQAQLRAILELADQVALEGLEFKAMEVDIIHPDTPTGRLGTGSVAARDQDPRNNLRPSFSQVELSMNRLYPKASNINTISLRTLVMPPGYQLCRFFFKYNGKNGERLDAQRIKYCFAETAERLPTVLRTAELPLGSRGFEFCEAAAVYLPQDSLFRYSDDLFGLAESNVGPISELILQAFIHNTRGYCRSVIEAVKYLLEDPAPKAFLPIGVQT